MLQDQAVVRQEIDVNVSISGILTFSRFFDHSERSQFGLCHAICSVRVFRRERSESFSHYSAIQFELAAGT